MDVRKAKSLVLEDLVALYLRLNGYFVTGLIVHSHEHGNIVSEIDLLAIRNAYSREPERQVEPSPFVDPVEGTTDLIIAEVKSKGQLLQFNESFRNSSSAIEMVLNWAGLFKPDDVPDLARYLTPLLQPLGSSAKSADSLPRLPGPGDTRITPLICSPDRSKRDAESNLFLDQDECFRHIWTCLCPGSPRKSSSTQYDFSAWGPQLDPIVRYFKDRRVDGDPGGIDDLYASPEVERRITKACS